MLRTLMRALSLSGGCAVLALLSVSTPSAAAVRLDVAVGFDNTYRTDEWTPVCVRISGQTQPTAGRLELRIRSRTGLRVYSAPVRLSGGPAPQLHWLYGIWTTAGSSGEEPTVGLIVDGREVATVKLDHALPLMDDGQATIACITQDLGGFAHLNGRDLGIRHPLRRPDYQQWQPGGGNPAQQSRSVRIFHPITSTLPDRAPGYRAVDAVVLGNVQPDALTDAQWEALARWVRDGGRLIVSGGSDDARLGVPALAALLPISSTSVAQIQGLEALAALAGSAPVAGSVPVVKGALRSDATALCSQGGVPLLTVRRAGLGTVLLTAFDLASPEVRGWPGQDALWRRMLNVTRQEQQLGEAVLQARRGGYSYGNGGGLYNALTQSKVAETPFIGTFLLAYIVCLVPLNYLFLRWRDKRELAWITAPVIIILFTTGAYALGYSVKGSTLIVRYCTVLEGSAGSEDFAAATLVGVFSPRQSRYNISTPDREAVVDEPRNEYYYGPRRDASDLAVERGDRTTIQGGLINMWDSRAFSVRSEVRPGGAVFADVTATGPRRLKVTITNHTPLALTGCAISTAGFQQSVAALAAGHSVTVSLDIQDTQQRSGVPLPGTYGAGAADPEAAAIQSKLANEAVSGELANAGVTPLVFAGWFAEDESGVRIDNAVGRTTHTGVMVVHLPAPGGGYPVPDRVPWQRMKWPNGRARQQSRPQSAVQSTAQSLNQLAYVQAARGDLTHAMQSAERALKLMPNDGGILDTVGEMHQRRKEYALAIRFYERALAHQAGGGLTETHEKLGETFLLTGQRAVALRHLKIAAADANSPWGQRARLSLGVGRSRPGPPTTRP